MILRIRRLKLNVQLTAITNPLVHREVAENESNFMSTMGVEEYIIWCARVSNPENRLNSDTAPKLLKYLIEHKHWSPFEMVSVGVEIVTSRAIAQQILRHRSFSFQEFSQRYSKVEAFEAVELRYQADKNRQSSTDICADELLNESVDYAIGEAYNAYEVLVANGIAKETARMVLPLATQTTIVMHGTLRSWIHFLSQRCDSHAQKEIQDIAFEIRNQLIPNFPWLSAALGWEIK
jgi:thymidylate synthase (FAD)